MRNKLDIRIKAEEFKKKLNITNGIDGKDGKDGKKGKDGIDGKDGKKGLKGDQGEQGEQGIDGSPDTPYDIKIKLESLMGEYRLDAFAIKNLPEWGGMAYNERRIAKWGTIQGTLSDQTDLQAALDDKWSKLGDAGTVDGTNFIGTTDNVAFNIRVNNQKAGRIDSVGSLFLGYQAGNVADYATTQNTGIGFQSLVVNTTGNYNVALGYKTLATNIGGSYNTAVGFEALFTNTNDYNTAFGYRALYANTSGSQNTVLGYQAGNALITGSLNVLIGSNAMLVNVLGGDNVSIGTSSLIALLSGNGNIAIGYSAGSLQTSGTGNIIIGYGTQIPVDAANYQLSIGNLIFGTGISGTGITPAGNMGVAVLAPTARLHLSAGTATASTAPLKFTTGTSLGTAEAGAVEMTTDDLFFTITTGAARKNITLWDTLGTSGRVPYATTNGRLIDSANMTFDGTTLTVSSITLPTFTLGSVLFAGTGGIITEDNANFFWNNTDNTLIIGAASAPSSLTKLYITQDNPAAGYRGFVIDGYADSLFGNLIIMRKGRGTRALPTATLLGDSLGIIGFKGYGATGFVDGGAEIRSFATENYSDTAQGGDLRFIVTSNGGTSVSEAMRINHDRTVGIRLTDADHALDIRGTVSTDQISLRSARAAIVSTDIIGGINFQSDDTNLSAPGNAVAQFRAIASETHTASALGTDFVWNTTQATTVTNAVRMRLSATGLGIGVTATTKLHVLKAGKTTARFDDSTAFAAGVGGDIVFGGNYRTAADVIPVARISAEKSNAVDGNYSYNLAFYTTNDGGANPNATTRMLINNIGNVGIGITPTAVLHLKAGTTAASTAPLKLTTGTSMTTAEAGAIEYTTDDLFFTIATGTARKRLLMADPVGGLTSGRVPFATTNGRLTDSANMTYATNRLSPTYITLAAGTAAAGTAPLKLTTGTNLTTAEGGAMEWNGINLFFTRVSGGIRENVITVAAVNSISPTAPNRTFEVVIDGNYYYIHAKTTND